MSRLKFLVAFATFIFPALFSALCKHATASHIHGLSHPLKLNKNKIKHTESKADPEVTCFSIEPLRVMTANNQALFIRALAGRHWNVAQGHLKLAQCIFIGMCAQPGCVYYVYADSISAHFPQTCPPATTILLTHISESSQDFSSCLYRGQRPTSEVSQLLYLRLSLSPNLDLAN